MTEHEYHQLADALMLAVEEQVEQSDVDLDFETNSGILTIIFPNGSKIIINKQAPLHQVWVATKFNGHHFEYHAPQWIDNRTGAEFWQFISQAASKQADAELSWKV